MEVFSSNGWDLYAHDYFQQRLEDLVAEVEVIAEKDPTGFIHHPVFKRFECVTNGIYKDVPANPDDTKFRQGKTLGKNNKHWRRIKKGLPNRYRLFFQFRSDAPKAIIYAWLNDEKTLRKANSKTDVYTVFQKMLEGGKIPNEWDDLLAAAEGLEPQTDESIA